MALPLFCQRLRDDLGPKPLPGIHLLQAPILVLEFLYACHQGGIHAGELGAPLVEGGVADTVLSAQHGNRAAGFGLLEDEDDLDVSRADVFI